MDAFKVICFAPCRAGFAGGSTDLPAYADRFGGAVLASTVSLGARAEMAPLAGSAVRLELADFDLDLRFESVERMQAEAPPAASLAAAMVAAVRPEGGVAVKVATGLPAGSGLGTSGAVGVALAYGLLKLGGKEPPRAEVAELASVVEIETLGRPIGRQDQYNAAFGGIHLFHFENGRVEREPITLAPEKRREFDGHFMLFFSGRRRNSAEVLAGQRQRMLADDAATLEPMHRLKALALEMAPVLAAGDWRRFGDLMHAAWLAKMGTGPKVADAAAQETCEGARARGAWAIKVSGAGGGGFYLVMAPPAAHAAVGEFLVGRGFQPYSFAFDTLGVHTLGD